MSILWRNLLLQYGRVLLLVLSSFIAILLVSRLQEISRFAAMGAPLPLLFRFILNLIPFILQIALPISCLISAVLLFQRLSLHDELTALRASGLGLSSLFAPLVVVSLLLSFGNFYVASELATRSCLNSRKMLFEMASTSPLTLLQNAKIHALKGAYVEMDPVHNGESAEHLLISTAQGTSKRLALLLADQVQLEGEEMVARNIDLLYSQKNLPHDDLVIEHQERLTTHAPSFSKLIYRKGWKVANDHLPLALLRARMIDLKEHGGEKEMRKFKKCCSEVVRRIALGLSPLTFTLMGAAFGIDVGRRAKRRGTLWVFGLGAFALAAFFLAKDLDHLFGLAALLFLLPHFIIVAASGFHSARINRGIA